MADITFGSVLLNIHQNLPALWRFVTAGTYLLGIIFFVRAIYLFKEYGEASVSRQSADIRRPIIAGLIAVALLYWPSMYHTMMQTVFRADSPLSYPAATENQFHDLVVLAGDIIQLIGFIAFVRGWVLLDRIAKQGAQPGALGRALAHIIGGIFAINIFATWEVLRTTLGIPG